MKFIIGKKIEMTQIWQADRLIAVTKVLAAPCTVVQVKTAAKDGYEAVQIGSGRKKDKNAKKPQKGHCQGLDNFAMMKEFRAPAGAMKRGDVFGVSIFRPGDIIQASGNSKGKGFQGGVRRHGFSGSKKTHGNKDQLRMPGSVGAAGPAHVFKGTRMAGRMGGGLSTAKNLEIALADETLNLLYIKGPVPGARNSYVYISGEGDIVLPDGQDAGAAEALSPEGQEDNGATSRQ